MSDYHDLTVKIYKPDPDGELVVDGIRLKLKEKVPHDRVVEHSFFLSEQDITLTFDKICFKCGRWYTANSGRAKFCAGCRPTLEDIKARRKMQCRYCSRRMPEMRAGQARFCSNICRQKDRSRRR